MLAICARKSEQVLVAQIPLFTLRRAELAGWTLSHSRLCGFDLRDANLSGATLRCADLSGANLCGADLSTCDLEGAVLTGARYDERTRWPEGFLPDGAGARRAVDGEAWRPGPAEAEARRRAERCRARVNRETAMARAIEAQQLQCRAEAAHQTARELAERTAQAARGARHGLTPLRSG